MACQQSACEDGSEASACSASISFDSSKSDTDPGSEVSRSSSSLNSPGMELCHPQNNIVVSSCPTICETSCSTTSGTSSRLLTLRNNVKPLRSFSSEPTTRQNSVDSSSSSESATFSDMPLGLFSTCSSPSRSVPSSPCGPKFKLIHEGDIQLCRLNHTRTVISKILSSKFLRRWETHRLQLSNTEISSKTLKWTTTKSVGLCGMPLSIIPRRARSAISVDLHDLDPYPNGFMEESIPFSVIEDVYVVARWDVNHKFCIRIVIPDGSLLLQVTNAYLRDQWQYSLLWKRNILRYQKLLLHTRRPEVLLKELKSLVDMSLTTPLQDECIYQTPMDLISEFLLVSHGWLPRHLSEDIISIISPLLERTTPSSEICDFLCQYCQENPRSSIVQDHFTAIVQRILKHNLDFGKYPKTRVFVQDYIQALSEQNDGLKVVHNFVSNMHGPASTCPHPRVLPNLVSIGLAAFYTLFEERRSVCTEDRNDSTRELNWDSRNDCFIAVFDAIASFEDWRPGLSQLLQPIPFPDDALAYERFTSEFKKVICKICTDYRCDVHLMVLGIRDEKEGWFHLYCPGGIACDDDGDLWSLILQNLLSCCCRRKRFLQTLNKCLGPCMLRALRDDEACQQALCDMLEMDVVENKDIQLQIITTLQSTASGKQHYTTLCLRQRHLRELQQKGGPRKLTLPSRSTDADVAKLLSCGSFGNLECLSLAFTQVTSACAEQLIKLPALRYLNLWSTQFGDSGLQLISEHLPKLQVLNLCETPVTDKGLVSLAAMKNLRKLNLNSTSLSAQTFEGLKQKLPALQECDIRYTDAW